MTGRERVLRAVNFEGPDRVPVDLWILPAARMRHGAQLEQLLDCHPRDIISVVGPCETGADPEVYQEGTFVDFWGCTWTNINPGIVGEVKGEFLGEDEALAAYETPLSFLEASWAAERERLTRRVAEARATGNFVIGGWMNPYERMQFLRGVENLYCDIALESDELFRLRQIVWDFYRAYIDRWMEQDTDAIVIGDDWGSQRSLLISPEAWRKVFKPMYRDLIDRVRSAGKMVFVHSDGYIYDLYPEFIELGVKAINSQLWCMDLEQIAENFAGKITFWGELSRQNTMPFGTPEEIREKAALMRSKLYRNGGLIGECEVGREVPLENIQAALESWNAE